MGILSDEEWTEQVKSMFDVRFMPDEVDLPDPPATCEPMDLLGVIEPPKRCCNEDFAA